MKRVIQFLVFMALMSSTAQELAWKTKWKFKTEGTIRSTPIIKNSKIYFANGTGLVYCLDKKNGDLIWEFNTGAAINGSPAVTDLGVYIINRNEEVYALNLNTGILNWKKSLKPTLEANIGGWKYFTAAPLVSGDRVYIGSGDGHLYALKVENGREDWSYNIGRRIRATPLIDGNTIYQPANDGKVHVLNKNTGKLLWTFETDGANPDPNDPFKDIRRGNYDQPNLVNNILVFGSRDGKTYAIDTKTHKEKWRLTYGSTWAMANTIHDGTVYMGWSTNNLVCAIELQTGKEKWKHQNYGHVYTKPLIRGNSVFYGCSSGQLYELNKETGEEIATYQVGGEIYSSPIFEDNTIYFGSDDGYLYAIEKGRKAYFAVYMPDSLSNMTRNVANPQLVNYLKEKEFVQLGKEELYAFMDNRVKDKEPSVVVFALPIIPEEVIGDDVNNGLFKKYLKSGGKVVWNGNIPNFFAIGKNDFFTRDVVTGVNILEVEFDSPYESGNYYSKTTQKGLNMGLPVWGKTTGAIVKLDEDIIPLSIDEYGNCSSWLKKFNQREGSGFISHRPWAWNVGLRSKDLEAIYQLAAYGLK